MKNKSRLIKFISLFIFMLILALPVLLALRGIAGNPNPIDLNSNRWKEAGPFELSPERGRYALAYSIIEQGSVFFTPDIARFTTPDLGYHNGKYVSLFAPTVSFIVAPGYLVGRYFQLAQVGTFAVIGLFGIINCLLIRAIAKNIGAIEPAAKLAGLIFLFATPAFAYTVTLYQHQISTFLILVSIYTLQKLKGALSLGIIFFIFAVSISVDNPNLFMMIPVVLYAFKEIVSIQKNGNDIAIQFKAGRIFAIITIIIPLLFFAWFNNLSYGSPFQLGGTVESVTTIDASGLPVDEESINANKDLTKTPEAQPDKSKKTAIGFFNSRQIIRGALIHLISRDRGVIFFTPIILAGIFGLFIGIKKNHYLSALLLAIIGFNILLYSMWADPWGGWAFGSRYLIPSYAMLAILLSLVFTKIRKNILVLSFLFIITIFSIFVNTLGAITSNANPPKIQIAALEQQTGRKELYSFDRNFNNLVNGGIKSYAYNKYFINFVNPVYYYIALSAGISLSILLLCIQLFISKKEEGL